MTSNMADSARQESISVGKDTNAAQLEELKKSITVDTLHNDEALKVLANYQGDETWTAEEEKKLTRKIDRRLLSILCITYGLQYYDKAMLSQAVSWNGGLAPLIPRTNFDVGFIWTQNRPRSQRRLEVLDVCCHLLSGFYMRRLSCHCLGSTIPNRAGHLWHRLLMGCVMPIVLRGALFSRNLTADGYQVFA